MSKARIRVRYVDAFEDRRDYLKNKLSERLAAGLESSYLKQEIGALDWAIPILTEALLGEHPTDQPRPADNNIGCAECGVNFPLHTGKEHLFRDPDEVEQLPDTDIYEVSRANDVEESRRRAQVSAHQHKLPYGPKNLPTTAPFMLPFECECGKRCVMTVASFGSFPTIELDPAAQEAKQPKEN